MRFLAKATAALLLGATLAVVGGAAPASAIDVNYQASKSCSVNGRVFKAHILTYGKPTATGAVTEVQLWGYWIEANSTTRDTYVEARTAWWTGTGWMPINGIYSWGQAIEDSQWHRGPTDGGTYMIGYQGPNGAPVAVLVRVEFDGNGNQSCFVVLRPYDLEWIG